MKSVIGEFTDAGPRVGVSNHEVTFPMAEMCRIQESIRRTRIHRSRGDLTKNECERTNGCIAVLRMNTQTKRSEIYRSKIYKHI